MANDESNVYDLRGEVTPAERRGLVSRSRDGLIKAAETLTMAFAALETLTVDILWRGPRLERPRRGPSSSTETEPGEDRRGAADGTRA